MMRRQERDNLKQQIIDAAWKLFHEKGYDNTTVNEIIRDANTSKGGFYYYFKAKDDLLNSLYSIFDREYEKFYKNLDKSQSSFVQLRLLQQYVAYFIEGNVSPELLAALYQSQLAHKRQDHFLDPERYYLRLVRKIITEGQEKGEIRDDIDADELVHHVLLLERGIIMDWSVQNGAFSLGFYGARNFELYSEFMKKK